MRSRCSKESFDFELKFKDGFKIHTTKEHNIFHYIGFFIYLRDKRDLYGEEFTALEEYVVNCVRVRQSCLTDAAEEQEHRLLPRGHGALSR